MTERKSAKQARSKTPKKQGWMIAFKVFLMLIWVAVAIIASQFSIGFLMISALGESTFDQPVWTAIFSALSYTLAMALVVLPPIIWRRRVKKAEKTDERNVLGLRGLPTWTDIGLAPVGFLAYYLLAILIVLIFSLFPWFDAEQVQDVGFNFLASGFDRIVAFITLVVVAPIAEEIIFRGWLYGKMRSELLKKLPDWASMVISILLVSILFGVLHGQWNVGVNVFAMSVVLCGLREITGTIYAGILLHMLKNGIAFYALYILGIG